MTPKQRPLNVAASVRARLLNLSRQRGDEFQLVLSEYATERPLHRLGVSAHADSFVLKGAMLLKLWSADRHRATWDLDLLGRGACSIDGVVAVVGELRGIEYEDGIAFDKTSIVGSEIRTQDEYAGVRVRMQADLAGARIPMQLDVGFNDAVIPGPQRARYPTLLDHAPPSILVYPREAVIAEKFEAMVSLGQMNGRMKDFYDVHLLATAFAFDGMALTDAIRATFERRKTALTAPRLFVLSREFLAAPERRSLWQSFRLRSRVDAPPDSAELSDVLQRFLGPPVDALIRGRPFAASWPPGGSWKLLGGLRDG